MWVWWPRRWLLDVEHASLVTPANLAIGQLAIRKDVHVGAFGSISEAIDAAIAGDTIAVRPGTYEEAVTVDKDITIVGDDLALTVIRPAPGSDACDSLEVTACAMALVVSDASTASITASEVSGGITVSGADPTIESDRIGWVLSEKGAAPRIERNAIDRLRLIGSGGLVRSNSIIGRGADTSGPAGVGVMVRRPLPDLEIRENRIARHRVGLSVAQGTSLAIRFNAFERNRIGVRMDSVGDANIEGNLFCQNRREPFRVRAGSVPTNLIEMCGSGG